MKHALQRPSFKAALRFWCKLGLKRLHSVARLDLIASRPLQGISTEGLLGQS